MRYILRLLPVLAVAALVNAAAAGASDAPLVQLTISGVAAGGLSSEISVDGTAGRYDRVVSPTISLPLALSAEPGPDAGSVKIVASELYLKAEGSGKDARGVAALPGAIPSAMIDVRQDFAFSLQPQGPVAQNAIALCNGLPSSERGTARKLTLSLAVVWRVTSGRFNFKWTSYDQLAPSGDIVKNRDFYTDQESSEVEAPVDAAVLCQPLTPVTAVASPVPAAVRPVTLVPAESNSMPAQTIALPVSSPAPVVTASLPERGKPRCDGGMVRQQGSENSGYLCLCPGNTKRVETGANAFACERGSIRR